MKTLQLSEDKAKELYKTASPEFKAMLEETFGKSFLGSVETVEDAKEYLGLSPNCNVWIEETYLERLKAFYNLSILCDAWNKQDGFVPDLEDNKQPRWYPVFSSAGFVFAHTYCAASYASANFGSRLCFKSKERSDEFGKKFEGLAKILLRK